MKPIVELYQLMENTSVIVKYCREVSTVTIGALKILVVDDQEGIRYLLDIIARDAGHEVIMAQNGLEGVEMCRTHDPDLIFMDIRMPIVDGIQAVKEIRKFNINVGIVIMTAYSEKKAIDELKTYGITALVSKPFDVKEIQQLLASYQKQKSNEAHHYG